MSSFVYSQTKSMKTAVTTGLLQRQCACGEHTIAGGACAERAKTSEGMVRRDALDHRAPGIAPPIDRRSRDPQGYRWIVGVQLHRKRTSRDQIFR
jgi:hypothetical protein